MPTTHSTLNSKGDWYCFRNILFTLNEIHSNFSHTFLNDFHKLLEIKDHNEYYDKMIEYVYNILPRHMFVRVERPRGSKRFLLAYVECNWVFSFATRFAKMRLRLNRIPPILLSEKESDVNSVKVLQNIMLRFTYIGDTDYELAQQKHGNTYEYGRKLSTLVAAIFANDNESVIALLDGGDDPNEIDEFGRNALHRAAEKGCCPSIFKEILNKIIDVNAGSNIHKWNALIEAVVNNNLHIVDCLMKHENINLNDQIGISRSTVLHFTISYKRVDILKKLLSDNRVDTTIKNNRNYTPLQYAIIDGRLECAEILMVHGSQSLKSS